MKSIYGYAEIGNQLVPTTFYQTKKGSRYFTMSKGRKVWATYIKRNPKNNKRIFKISDYAKSNKHPF